MKQIVDNLLKVYGELKEKNMPDKNALIDIIGQIRVILFPNHFGTPELNNDNAQEELEKRLTKLERDLTAQIFLAYGQKCNKAQMVADEFLNSLPSIRITLDKDILATLNGDPAAESVDQIIVSYPGIFAILVYRIAHFFHEKNVPTIPRMLTEYAHSVTGIDIHPGAVIGNNFFIDHGTGIVIGETTIIGDNVKIYQGVTLGALSIKSRESTIGKKRHPTIKNGVTIYSGVSILGGDTIIGENCIIGGNAFITSSIPDNTKVSAEMPKLTLGKRKS